MIQPIKKKKKKKKYGKLKGLPPGSLVHIGNNIVENVEIELIEYNQTLHTEIQLDTIEEATACLENKHVSWININGISDTKLIGEVGKIFNLHPLLLEDVLNTEHRPKTEEFESYIFCTFKMLSKAEDSLEIESEQISLVLGTDFVLSFQEKKGDVFDPVRQRIKVGKGLSRSRKADYLVYMLIDIVVDNYYEILEDISEKIEELEERIFEQTEEKQLSEVQTIKKTITNLRKTINPLKEMVSGLIKSPSTLIHDHTKDYFRDVQDHLIQLVDNLETYREWNAELKDIYLSSLSNKMNQIMKVLTIISTIFIPLTFIAGIYGMNFQYMPELSYPYAYPLVWGFMLIIFLVMIYYFRRKKWF